jgi:hypothetical protein
MAELRQLAGDGDLSDAIRELIHAQYTARLYAQAGRDAERLRNDPADLALLEWRAIHSPEGRTRGPLIVNAARPTAKTTMAAIQPPRSVGGRDAQVSGSE